MSSPSDRAATRMDQSAFACVPRHLVEEFHRLLEKDAQHLSLSEGFEHNDQINAAAREIADAAVDDIN